MKPLIVYFKGTTDACCSPLSPRKAHWHHWSQSSIYSAGTKTWSSGIWWMFHLNDPFGGRRRELIVLSRPFFSSPKRHAFISSIQSFTQSTVSKGLPSSRCYARHWGHKELATAPKEETSPAATSLRGLGAACSFKPWQTHTWEERSVSVGTFIFCPLKKHGHDLLCQLLPLEKYTQ